jgi:hypothetical protein
VIRLLVLPQFVRRSKRLPALVTAMLLLTAGLFCHCYLLYQRIHSHGQAGLPINKCKSGEKFSNPVERVEPTSGTRGKLEQTADIETGRSTVEMLTRKFIKRPERHSLPRQERAALYLDGSFQNKFAACVPYPIP